MGSFRVKRTPSSRSKEVNSMISGLSSWLDCWASLSRQTAGPERPQRCPPDPSLTPTCLISA